MMQLPALAAFTIVLAIAPSKADLVLLQLNAAVEKETSSSTKEQIKPVPVLERGKVGPYLHSDITLESCTFVKALGAKSGNFQVYMLGDSTVFHQAKGACMAATKHFQVPDGPWSKPGFGKLMMLPEPPVELTKRSGFADATHFKCEIPLPKNGKLTIVYWGIGRPPHDFDDLKYMAKLYGPKPDVFYFGAGLHYMHMEPSMHWHEAAFEAYKNLEKDVPKFLSSSMVKASPTVVYFKTHAICDERYQAAFMNILHDLKNLPQQGTAEKCVASVSKALHTNVTSQECLDSYMVRENAMKLNNRIMAALNKCQGKQVKYVDGFGITDVDKCAHSDYGDGRHYTQLVPRELAELLKHVGSTGSADTEYIKKAGC